MSNKTVVRRFVETYGKKHDAEGCRPLFAPNARITVAIAPQVTTLEEYIALGHAFLAGSPDIDCSVVAQIAEGETVATHVIWTGTQTGPLPGLPLTGRSWCIDALMLDRFENGVIVERIEFSNRMDFLQQLGAVPALQAG